MGKRGELSRRSVLGGMLAASAPLAAVKALAGVATPEPQGAEPSVRLMASSRSRPRTLHSAVAMADGSILITGGYTGSHGAKQLPTASVELFDVNSGEYIRCASMLSPRARHASVLLPDGRVAVLGGYSRIAIASVEIYDPRFDTWTAAGSLPEPMCDHTAVVAKGALVIQGGQRGLVTHVLEIGFTGAPLRP